MELPVYTFQQMPPYNIVYTNPHCQNHAKGESLSCEADNVSMLIRKIKSPDHDGRRAD